MRLLKREKSGWLRNSYTFSVTKFDPQDIPSQYAILSHRWGPDEVTIRDIKNGTAKTKAGYRKLQFCAEQAARDGLIYFWIDTCCIDRANSVELSEAINSMFKWYQNARKCYVYLPDVSAKPNWESVFRESEWFTRGWTLQELIAPAIVEFFSVEGKKLGDKRSLQRLISHITKIPAEVLQGQSLYEVDERERLSWTVKRRTTIEEDAVYCLLGIFGIHMTLIYGEGQAKALARLQRKIQRGVKPRPPATPTTNALWIVPFERNPHFTGRESQLTELLEQPLAKDHTSRMAVTGLGGVGKTQLVIELLYRMKEKHPDCLIIWIPATNFESLQQGYLTAAQQLGIPGCENQKADVKKMVQDYLGKEDAGSWLLVFDNADDINMWTAPVAGSRRLIDYLPNNKRGRIVFTTRDRKAAVKLAQQNIITLSEMSEDAATQLFKKSLANPDLANNTRDIPALLAALTYLPLAITQATAYINANGITLADYVSLLKDKEEGVIDVLSEDFEDLGRYQNARNPVAMTWLISFEQVRRADPLAADYLSFIACVNPREIPESLLPSGPSRKRELEAIGTLAAYSFISRRPGESSIDLHRLVHLATRNWLRKEELLVHWTEKTVMRLEEVFPDEDYKNRTMWRSLLPHTRPVLESNLISKDGSYRIALMWRCGRCLHSDGRWDEAEATFSEILTLYRKMYDEENPSVLSAVAWVASTYWHQGRWAEAEKLQVKVMETRKKKLGSNHPDTLTSIANLASTYSNQGRWEEAKHLQVQVMEARKRTLGMDHPDTLTGIAWVASTYRDQGRWEEAEQLQMQVMETRKATLGMDHPDTLTSMANLASTYSNQGRWAEAEELQVQVMELRKKKLGLDHPDTLTGIAWIASTYRDQGRYAEAEELQIQVMEVRMRKLGRDHPDTVTGIANLASTYSDQRRWEEAERLQIQVMETRKRKLGLEHPDTLTSIAWVASTYTNQDRWEDAERLQMEVWDIRKRKLGLDHPDTLSSMNNLAFTWNGLHKQTQAIELMRDCCERRTRILGPAHPHTISSKGTLADWESARSVNTITVPTWNNRPTQQRHSGGRAR